MTTFEFTACCIGLATLAAGCAWVVWYVALFCVEIIKEVTYLSKNALFMRSWNRIVPAMEYQVRRTWMPEHEQEIVLRFLSAVSEIKVRGDAKTITRAITKAIEDEFITKEPQ